MKDIIMRYIYIAFFALMMMPLVAQAQSKNDPKPPKALADMVKTGSQIYYLGQYEGMNGWALIRQGKPEFFYENESRTGFVMGLLFNKEGEMLTTSQLSDLNNREGDDMYAATGGVINKETEVEEQAKNEETKPSSDDRPATAAEKMYVDLLSANWITMNPQGIHDIFAFIDPDCPHCKTFVKDVQPLLKPGGLRVRVIPMGSRPDSMRKAALLLASANPAERLTKYIYGEAELNAPDNINTVAAEKNMTLMLKHGFDVTPIIVYRTLKGEIRMIRGRPSDYEMVLNDIKDN